MGTMSTRMRRPAPSKTAPQRERRSDDTEQQDLPRRPTAPLGLTGAIAQAKLAVGPASDPFEREADAVADSVVRRLSGGSSAATTAPDAVDHPARPTRVQRSATIGAAGGTVDNDTDRAIQSSRGGGSALPVEARAKMEHAFGADFGQIRVHQGARAAELSDRIQAKAFTVGRDVYFRDGMPDVGTASGQHLLAHELTHTIQQGSVSQRRDTDGAADVRRTADTTVQRLMPTKKWVENAVGPAIDDKKTLFGGLKEKSKLYKPILARLQAVDNWLRRTKFAHDDPAAADKQLATYNFFLDDLEKALLAFITHKGKQRRPSHDIKKKLAYMQSLLGQIGRERVVAAESSRSYQRGIDMGATWMGVVMNASSGAELAAPAAVDLRHATEGDSFGGGINQVTQYTKSGVMSGFKEQQGAPKRSSEMTEIEQMTEGATTYAFEDFDMPFDRDPEMAKRDVAMARLDQLLRGGVIARAELAFKGVKSGSIMDWSTGKKAADVKGQVQADDPELQRLMSRMQMIDIIAMQADRHAGNFMLHVESGRVVGLTGIDNDLSFGKRTAIDKGRQEFNPLQKYVDKDMAERILRLDPNDLRWALGALLSPGEITAALKRLELLKVKLKEVQSAGGFLNPNEWTAEVARGMLEENSIGYYAKAHAHLGDG
ncbi:eCIS core domain-containing protein [Ilumatobacter coccineus]|uniref:eCIS core domain-containing protein n=1 Tax=Ilumatobacter coccineus (strain NBRC 103263 / KCTC 29153 / YM16-304) TaxID=1313172 RepID=A0A6C7E2R4_ILUCY|nr:DUF4157 domain-containing protein [Ilumatobacter coccineus]BAN01347.1 hypothetical protein YM304_10330 [Ilumatobacter coccineus YM16-304]